MRHKRNTKRLSRTTSHRRCMVANALKSLVVHNTITTTEPKAKVLRAHADRLISIAKVGTLAARRQLIADLMISFNPLTSKEKRSAKAGDKSAYNDDRIVLEKLFTELVPRFAERTSGYTRLIKVGHRVGDGADVCVLEYIK